MLKRSISAIIIAVFLLTPACPLYDLAGRQCGLGYALRVEQGNGGEEVGKALATGAPAKADARGYTNEQAERIVNYYDVEPGQRAAAISSLTAPGARSQQLDDVLGLGSLPRYPDTPLAPVLAKMVARNLPVENITEEINADTNIYSVGTLRDPEGNEYVIRSIQKSIIYTYGRSGIPFNRSDLNGWTYVYPPWVPSAIEYDCDKQKFDPNGVLYERDSQDPSVWLKFIVLQERGRLVQVLDAQTGRKAELVRHVLGGNKWRYQPPASAAAVGDFVIDANGYKGPVSIVGKVGGTSIVFQAAIPGGLVDGTRVEAPTLVKPDKTDTEDEVMTRLTGAIAEVIDMVGADRVINVSYTAPGFFNPDMTLQEPEQNIPCLLTGFSFKDETAKRLAQRFHRHSVLGDIPVKVKHDGTGGAEGELSVFGTYPGADDIFYVIAGTGIGTRRIKNGEPYLGDARVKYLHNEGPHNLIFNGDDANPDYTYVGLETQGMHPDFDSVDSPYHGKQDLEDRAAGPGLVRRLLNTVERDRAANVLDEKALADIVKLIPDGQLGNLTAKEIGIAANQGNELALSIVKGCGRELGIGLAVFFIESERIFDGFTFPKHVVIGSGVAQIGPIYLEAIKDGARSRLEKYAQTGVKLEASPEELAQRFELSKILKADDAARELISGLPTESQVTEHAEKMVKAAATGTSVRSKFMAVVKDIGVDGRVTIRYKSGTERTNLKIVHIYDNEDSSEQGFSFSEDGSPEAEQVFLDDLVYVGAAAAGYVTITSINQLNEGDRVVVYYGDSVRFGTVQRYLSGYGHDVFGVHYNIGAGASKCQNVIYRSGDESFEVRVDRAGSREEYVKATVKVYRSSVATAETAAQAEVKTITPIEELHVGDRVKIHYVEGKDIAGNRHKVGYVIAEIATINANKNYVQLRKGPDHFYLKKTEEGTHTLDLRTHALDLEGVEVDEVTPLKSAAAAAVGGLKAIANKLGVPVASDYLQENGFELFAVLYAPKEIGPNKVVVIWKDPRRESYRAETALGWQGPAFNNLSDDYHSYFGNPTRYESVTTLIRANEINNKVPIVRPGGEQLTVQEAAKRMAGYRAWDTEWRGYIATTFYNVAAVTDHDRYTTHLGRFITYHKAVQAITASLGNVSSVYVVNVVTAEKDNIYVFPDKATALKEGLGSAAAAAGQQLFNALVTDVDVREVKIEFVTGPSLEIDNKTRIGVYKEGIRVFAPGQGALQMQFAQQELPELREYHSISRVAVKVNGNWQTYEPAASVAAAAGNGQSGETAVAASGIGRGPLSVAQQHLRTGQGEGDETSPSKLEPPASPVAAPVTPVEALQSVAVVSDKLTGQTNVIHLLSPESSAEIGGLATLKELSDKTVCIVPTSSVAANFKGLGIKAVSLEGKTLDEAVAEAIMLVSGESAEHFNVNYWFELGEVMPTVFSGNNFYLSINYFSSTDLVSMAGEFGVSPKTGMEDSFRNALEALRAV